MAWLDDGRSLEESDSQVYALRSSRVVLPRRPCGALDGHCAFSDELEGFDVVGATIIVRGERIETVLRHDEDSSDVPSDCFEMRDVGDLVVMPGVVDAGARFGECPGLAPGSSSDCWEGFEVGTRAAAAGGVTTTIDLPSLDASPQEANDVRGRAELAARVSAVDVALAVRLESTMEDGDDESSESSCRRAAALLSELDVYMSAGAVAAASFLTPPSWAARGIDVDSLARVLRTLACRRFAAQSRETKQRTICTSRGRAGGHMVRAKQQSRQQQGVIPIFLNTVKLATEDLGPASPFRHLPFAARLEAKSPLMLLPFYQVESSPPVENKRSSRHLVASPLPLSSTASEVMYSPTFAHSPSLDQLKIPCVCDSARSVDSRRTLNSASRGRANAGAACDPTILAGLDTTRQVPESIGRLASQAQDDVADKSSQADDDLPEGGIPEQQSQHAKKPKARAETIWEVIPFEETVIVSGDDKSATNAATFNATAAASRDKSLGCCYQTFRRTSSTGAATACVGSASSGVACYGGGLSLAAQSSRDSISDFEVSLTEDCTIDSSVQPAGRAFVGNFMSDDNFEPSHDLSKQPETPAADRSPCTRCIELDSKATRDCVGRLRINSPTSSTEYADNSDYHHAETPGHYHAVGADNSYCDHALAAEISDYQHAQGAENRDYHRAVSSEEYHSPPRYAPRSRSSKDVKTDEAQSWVKSLLQAELATYSASRPPTPAQLPSDNHNSRQRVTTTDPTRRRGSVVDRDGDVVVIRGRQQTHARRRRRLSRWDESTKKSLQRRDKCYDGDGPGAQQQRRSVLESAPTSLCRRRSDNPAPAPAGLLDQILGFIPVAQGSAARVDKDKLQTRAEFRGGAPSDSADRRKCAQTSAGENTRRRRAARATAPVLSINIIARPPSPPRLGFERVSTWAEEAASPLGGVDPGSPTVVTEHGASSVVPSIDGVEGHAEEDCIDGDSARTTAMTTATREPPVRPKLVFKSFSARSACSASGSDRGSDDEHRDEGAARHVRPPLSAPVATAGFLSTLLQQIVMPSCDNDTRKSSAHMDNEVPPTLQPRFVLVRRCSGFRRSGPIKRSAGVRSRSFDSRLQPDERHCDGVSRHAHHKLVRVVVANSDDAAPETLVFSRNKWTSGEGIADADGDEVPTAGVAATASSSKRSCSLNKVPATLQSTAPVRKKPIIASISKGTFVELKGSETLTAQAPHTSNPPAASHVTRNMNSRSATDDDLTLADDGEESSPTSRNHSSLSGVGSIGLDPGADVACGAFNQRCSSTSTECLRTSDGSEESSSPFGALLGNASDTSLVNVPAVIEVNTSAPAADVTGTSSSTPTQIDRGRGFGRKRPPPIKIFKENDQHTRRAVRQDYSLYCDNHRSSAGSEGLRLLWNSAAQYVAASCGDSSLLGGDVVPDDYDEDENDLEDGRDYNEDSGLVDEDDYFFLSTSSLGTPKEQFPSTGACKLPISPPFSPPEGKRRRRRSSRPGSPANENAGGVGNDDNDSLTSCVADTEEGDVGGLDDDDDDDDPFPMVAAASHKVPASLHVSRVATLQTVRVLEDCQSHDVTCAASGVSPLFGGLITGSVACYNLLFAEEDVPYGATIFKVAPPIRHEAHRRALWQSLRAKSISVVTSGHTPVQPEGKPSSPGDFSRAIAGTLIGANELFLSALWTAARHEGFDLGDIAACLAAEPANLLQLAPRKGAIRDGADADFVLFDPDMEWAVDWTRLVAAGKLHTDQLNHRRHRKHEKIPAHPDISNLKFVARPTQAPCLYDGKVLTGKVIATILRGRLVYRKGSFRDKPIGNVVAGRGRVVKRADAYATSHPA